VKPTLELKIPPVVVWISTAALMGGAAWAQPYGSFQIPARVIVAVLLAIAGVVISVLGVVAFRRRQTTVNPLKPETASALVVAGIYRHTRNPMYVGLGLILVGWGIFLKNALALIFVPAFVLYMNRFQIRPEERALARIFGPEFAAYQSRVRRWL
jgi:protein-S-isoprenylcysteine O-methyltransferase Ste14